jgi:hypothetical protein
MSKKAATDKKVAEAAIDLLKGPISELKAVMHHIPADDQYLLQGCTLLCDRCKTMLEQSLLAVMDGGAVSFDLKDIRDLQVEIISKTRIHAC